MKNDIKTIFLLVKRGLKIFLKDKMTVFFSLLAPLIVLVLFVLFLREMQLSSLKTAMEGAPVDEALLGAFIDGWMLAGVMAVSCITVSFSANNIMVQDKQRSVINDALASPVRRGVLTASYYVYNFIVTLVICAAVLAVGLIYLAISGWYLSFADVANIVALLLFSALSATAISVFVCSFLKSESALGGLVGIMSAAIGFLCGAYFPLSMLSDWIGYAVLVIPGTYSAGLFRNFFMNGALEKIAQTAPGAEAALKEGYSMQLDFFGTELGTDETYLIFAALTLVFVLLNVLVTVLKGRKTRKKTPHNK